MAKPEVSAVVVTYNRPRLLLECLDSLSRQSFQNFEIIVVDNGGNDLARKDILSFDPLYLKMKNNIAVPIARNVGSSFSNSKYVGFIDDDAVCDDNFVKIAINILNYRQDIIVVSGKICPKTKNIYNKIQSHYDLGDKPLIGYFREGCSFVRKEAWSDVSHYNDMVFRNGLMQGHEGIVVLYAIGKKYGARSFLYEPSMIIFHDFSSSFKHYLIKRKNHKQANFYYQKYFPELANYIQNEHYFEKSNHILTKRTLIDKIKTKFINILTKIYLKFFITED